MFFPTTTSRNIEFGETSGLQENSFCCRLLISSPDTRSGDLHFGSFGIVKFCNHWCNSNMWQSQYQPFWCKVISLKTLSISYYQGFWMTNIFPIIDVKAYMSLIQKQYHYCIIEFHRWPTFFPCLVFAWGSTYCFH